MQRILIIRLSAIGDVAFASPIIHALRQRYPNAHIAWLAEPFVKDLLIHHPELDEVIVWNKARWKQLRKAGEYRQLWSEMRAFVRELRARHFDTVLDMQGLLKSGVWAWLSGAKRRIGLGSREGSQRLMTEVVERAGEENRIGSEYQHLAAHLGLETEPFSMRVEVDSGSESAMDTRLAERGLDQFIAVCPFTTRPQKHWIESQWQALLPQLEEQTGMPVIMLGGPGDVDAATSLEMPGVLNWVGQTRLLEAVRVLEKAALVVGVDTGLTHIGIAKQTPVVAIFGSTCPYTWSPGAQLDVLHSGRECSPCRRNPTCDGRFDCMRDITPERVLSSALGLLQAA